MLNLSIYPIFSDQENIEILETAKVLQSEFVFTSLHIPEASDLSSFMEKLKQYASQYKVKFIADISPETFKMLNIQTGDITYFVEHGIEIIRLDYGFTQEEIKNFSKQVMICINASTINEANLVDLVNAIGAEKILAMHNFYPRKDTGIGIEFFNSQNKMFKKYEVKIATFIPGDKKFRGPIFEMLPTIEKHRGQTVFLNYIEMVNDEYVDYIFTSEKVIEEKTIKLIDNFLNNNVITIQANLSKDYQYLYNQVWTNRRDFSENVIRCAESRTLIKTSKVKPENTTLRGKGSITIDNELYGRYSGEIQVTKIDLAVDERVNKIGEVSGEDLNLLQYVKGGMKFTFQEI